MGNDNGGVRTDQQNQNSIQEKGDSVGGGDQSEGEGLSGSITFLLWA